jgi:hypothetical protein
MHSSGASRREIVDACIEPSLRAKRSNPDYHRGHSMDCFVASLLAMTIVS